MDVSNAGVRFLMLFHLYVLCSRFFSVFSLFTCRLRHVRSHLKESLLSAVVSFIVMFVICLRRCLSALICGWTGSMSHFATNTHAALHKPPTDTRVSSFTDNNDCTGILQLWCSKEPCGTAVGFVQMRRVLERDLVRTWWNLLS